MSEAIITSHNQSVLLYHFVCPAKYRRKVFSKEVTSTLKEVCNGISERYEVHFIEIGSDEDHLHFLIQTGPPGGIPMLSAKQLIQLVKSITAREIFRQHPQVKKLLWGGNFWTSGYYVNTVGRYADENMMPRAPFVSMFKIKASNISRYTATSFLYVDPINRYPDACIG